MLPAMSFGPEHPRAALRPPIGRRTRVGVLLKADINHAKFDGINRRIAVLPLVELIPLPYSRAGVRLRPPSLMSMASNTSPPSPMSMAMTISWGPGSDDAIEECCNGDRPVSRPDRPRPAGLVLRASGVPTSKFRIFATVYRDGRLRVSCLEYAPEENDRQRRCNNRRTY